jgi:hypothetical protein
MADLSRKDLVLILERAEKATEYERKCAVPEEQRLVTVSVTTLRRMVAMSLRAVSAETLRHLALAEDLNEQSKVGKVSGRDWSAFCQAARVDLREAALDGEGESP